VVVQSPNFLGTIEAYAGLAEAAHAAGALLVAVADPLSLAVLKPPGEQGADIAVGEGQPLGNPMSFGGPALGPEGLKEAALATAANARRLYELLLEAPGVEPLTRPPFFAEFALRLPRSPEEVRRTLAAAGFHGAYPIPEYGERAALFAATERLGEDDLYAFARAFFQAVGG